MVRLTRVGRFSAAHNFWYPDRSAEENARVFGAAASEGPHGHNYQVELTVSGEVDPATGMVVNIIALEKALQERVLDPLHLRWLNEDVPFFSERPPSLENLAGFIADRLQGALDGCALERIRAREADDLYVDFWPGLEGRPMHFTRKYEFCAAHRLYAPDLTEAQNREMFGKCANPSGHGHNYTIEVSVTGEIDPVSGMMVDMVGLDAAVSERVLEYLDHMNLNADIPEFLTLVATTENLTMVIWNRLKDHVPGRLAKVTVRETSNNIFEYTGD